ncbi:VOC family protein [Enterococcus cecorum]|uniref:VOC family protein n=1 Tax=Enterococcus cecorum TaxID=44008 RepID=UPI002ACACCC6|nr:VOC family protein [Enterococcus cecorum]MDZ5501314.1 VOC family protein [Enterococcus cecorum]MDZ5508135.1 VOC family protein [Enterococcus cecorum]MDZ5555182.1 VOC family protein [Enterococcus cecorum]MDZ5557454.1 VOC family protein [Enterococcus cecorum]MDZ5570333.1 VOC family protein [Enterococcus cecorum]
MKSEGQDETKRNRLVLSGGSAEAASEQCGWIVDKYGISWQIVPRMFLDFAQKLSPTTYQKINQQILTMKKIEIAQIEKLI